jgi:RNA polymerase I-specific transcription-initiation factor
MTTEGPTAPSCSEDSFVISPALVGQGKSFMKEIQTLCVVPALLKLSATKEISGPGRTYLDRDVRFYQLFKLSVNLALSCSLCATSPPMPRPSGRPPKHLSVQAPTTKVPKVSKLSSALVVEDQFIVPDSLDDSQYILESVGTSPAQVWRGSPGAVQNRGQNQLSMTFNAHRLFKKAFFERQDKDSLRSSSPGKPYMMAEYMEQVWNAVMEKKEHGLQGTSTLYVTIPLFRCKLC